MLLSKTGITRWVGNTRKRYIGLGYKFTHINDTFEVKVEDLLPTSTARVTVQCDYCQKQYQTKWINYIKGHSIINKDCCNDPKCTGLKAHEAVVSKYGSEEDWSLHIKEKREKTFLEKYGVKNPFANEKIKKKIHDTMMEKYGSYFPPSSIQKAKETCLKKYGVEYYTQTPEYRESVSDEKSPHWKGRQAFYDYERKSVEYIDWRKSVMARDRFRCQCCGAYNHKGFGKNIGMEAHHILNFRQYADKRYDIDNGITLCVDCHHDFHLKYGKKDNNKQQLDEFIFNHKLLRRMKRYAELIGIETIRAMG